MDKKIFTDAWTLAKRDLKRDFSPIKQILSVAAIIAFLLLIARGGDAIVDATKIGGAYSSFFLPGMIALIIGMASFNVGLELITDRKGFTKLVLVAPVTRTSILLGKMLSLLIEMAKSYLLIAIILMVSLGMFSIWNIVMLAVMVFVTTTVFLGFAFLASAFIQDRKTAEYVNMAASGVMFFLSGTFYPITAFPKILQFIAYANPMVYASDGFRFAMTGKSVLSVWIVGMLLAAFVMMTPLFVYVYDKKLRS